MRNIKAFNLDSILETFGPPPAREPKMDPRLLQLEQLHILANEAFRRSEYAEHVANQAKLANMKFCAEIRVRMELLKEELGIEVEESDE